MTRLVKHSDIRVAAVIPIHNGRDLTLRLLDSLLTGSFVPDIVIVVDDGSSDGSADAISDRFPVVQVVSADGSLWWSGAFNMGAQVALQAGCDFIWSLNNDCVVEHDSLSLLLHTLKVTPGAVACPRVHYWPDDGRTMSLGGTVNWFWRGPKLRGYAQTLPRDYVGGLTDVEWLPAMGLLLPAKAFQMVGGVDASIFPHYRGDIDFSLRLVKHGWRLLVDTRSVIYNDKSQTGLGLSRKPSGRELWRLLTDTKSQYNLRETIPFFFRHAPRLALPSLFVSYYGTLLASFCKRRLGG
jgi:N-acetylglucosaminyl-diphospho-decaprenol L-rhamnosyltransferase